MKRPSMMRYPEAGSQVAFSRAATALAVVGVGALAVGAVAVGRVAIRSLKVKEGKIERLYIDELRVRRLHVQELVAEAPDAVESPRPFDVLEGHNYVSLTTFRKSGEAVPTTVWFALVGDRVYVTTPPESGKMKRIRNNPRVILTPSNARGKPRGQPVEGIARSVENEETGNAEQALREKYRLGISLLRRFVRQEIGQITLEIRPADVPKKAT